MIPLAGPTASARRPLTIAVDVISAGSGLKPGAGGMINYYEGLLGPLAKCDEVARVLAFVSPTNGSLGIPSHKKIDIQVCHGLREDRFTRVLYEQLVLPIVLYSWQSVVSRVPTYDRLGRA